MSNNTLSSIGADKKKHLADVDMNNKLSSRMFFNSNQETDNIVNFESFLTGRSKKKEPETIYSNIDPLPTATSSASSTPLFMDRMVPKYTQLEARTYFDSKQKFVLDKKKNDLNNLEN